MSVQKGLFSNIEQSFNYKYSTIHVASIVSTNSLRVSTQFVQLCSSSFTILFTFRMISMSWHNKERRTFTNKKVHPLCIHIFFMYISHIIRKLHVSVVQNHDAIFGSSLNFAFSSVFFMSQEREKNCLLMRFCLERWAKEI